jgi:hypothetical protein
MVMVSAVAIGQARLPAWTNPQGQSHVARADTFGIALINSVLSF